MSTREPLNVPVVEWSPRGAAVLDPNTGHTSTSDTLQEALGRIGNPREVGVAVSRQSSFVKAMWLPDVGRDDARQVLNMAMSRAFPSGVGELAFDFRTTAVKGPEGRLAVVGAVKSETLARIHQELGECGTKAAWVCPTAVGSMVLAAENGVPNAVLLEPRDDGLCIDVVSDGVLRYSRVAPPVENEGELEAEVLRTLGTAQCDSAPVIATGGAELAGAERSLHGTALLALRRHSEARLHVEPPEAEAKRRQAKVRARARLAALLWVAVLAAGTTVYLDRSDRAAEVAKTRRALSANVRSAKSERDAAQSLAADTKRLQEGLSLAFHPAQLPSDALVQVSNAAPSGAWLSGLTFERGKPLLIRGTAMENTAVGAYLSALAASPRLRDVKLVFANDAQLERRSVVNFSFSAHVVGNLPLNEEKAKRKGGTR